MTTNDVVTNDVASNDVTTNDVATDDVDVLSRIHTSPCHGQRRT